MSQFIFDLEVAKNYNEHDFIVNATNKKAVDLISLWPDWHNKAAILYGESKSGKSHLGSIWLKRSGAKLIDIHDKSFKYNINDKNNYLIDNFSYIQPQQENIILDIFNKCLFNDNYILFLCNNEKKINFCLKDLESRFNSVLSTSINDPDDQIVDVLINKFFSDNQVLISIEVIKYLSGRIDRSYKELYKTLEKINNVSLKNKQKITIPFLRQYFFN